MNANEPVFMIGIAAKLCGVHPQTLRAYERLGFVTPARINEKNRLYSERDLERVRQVQRLTQDMGVNLAGVEVILSLLDQIEEMRADMEGQMRAYVEDAERRLASLLRASNVPVRRDSPLLPVPRIHIRKRVEL
jgi:MerR family transcriptional regulator/heat shock protein HspR